MGRSKHSGAFNLSGKESEQSKVRRGMKNIPDSLSGSGSTSDKVKKYRKKMKKALDKAMK